MVFNKRKIKKLADLGARVLAAKDDSVRLGDPPPRNREERRRAESAARKRKAERQ